MTQNTVPLHLSRRRALGAVAGVGLTSLALPTARVSASGGAAIGHDIFPTSILTIEGPTYTTSTAGTADIDGLVSPMSLSSSTATTFTFSIPSGYKDLFTSMTIRAWGSDGENSSTAFGGTGAYVESYPTFADGDVYVVTIGGTAATGTSSSYNLGRGGRGVGVYKRVTNASTWLAIAGGGGGAGSDDSSGGVGGGGNAGYDDNFGSQASGTGYGYIYDFDPNLSNDSSIPDNVQGQFGGLGGYGGVVGVVAADRGKKGVSGYQAPSGGNGASATTSGSATTLSLGAGGTGANGTGTTAAGSAGGGGGGSGWIGGGGGGADCATSWYTTLYSQYGGTLPRGSGGGGAGGNFGDSVSPSSRIYTDGIKFEIQFSV